MALRRPSWAQALVAFAAILLAFLFLTHHGQQYSTQTAKQKLARSWSSDRPLTNGSYLSNSEYSLHDPRALPSRPRPNPDIDEWDDFVQAGAWLLCMMRAPLSDVAGTQWESEWTHPEDILAFGWQTPIKEEDEDAYEDPDDWGTAMVSLLATRLDLSTHRAFRLFILHISRLIG